MCKVKTPKQQPVAPSVIDTQPQVEEERTRRRRRRGFLSSYTKGFGGDSSAAPVAVKELTGQ